VEAIQMNRTVLIAAAAALGLLVIVAGLWHLHGKQQEHEQRVAAERAEERVAVANMLAASRAATGRAYLASQDWEAALKALHKARATENATDFEEIDSLIALAEQGQANALLEKALSALRRREVPEGLRLLKAYLAHPRASKKKRAEQLVAQVRRASAADRAAVQLRRLSDAELLTLEVQPPPAGLDALLRRLSGPSRQDLLTDAVVQPIFLDTLRAGLAKERQRRAALLAARLERERRGRDTAPYKEMAELAAGLRQRYLTERAMLDKQKRALTRLVRELNITGEDLDKLRKEIEDAEKKTAALKQTFAARRGAARKAFQALKDFTRTDLEVFEQLLDRLGEGVTADKT
jgi:hypothetical protein